MKFGIEIVLSITHKKLITSMDNVYKILNYMLDDNLFTHQLPRAARFCKSFVIAEHPQLDEWNDFNEQITSENYKEYVEKAETMFGKELEISKVPGGVWTLKDAVEELEGMVPKEKIISIKIEDKSNNNICLN
ncbi:MAG: hypothetical protein M0P61_00250 [Ignavibacteriaceae bacterium]|jgi:hypothetical protein|nr:hypothetical protein [Ignavibacteriaceae bacterium]